MELLNQRLRAQNELLANELEDTAVNEQQLQLNRNSAATNNVQSEASDEETRISRNSGSPKERTKKKKRKKGVD